MVSDLNRSSFADAKGTDFVTELASKAPVPGGGGAAAFVGAIGTALGNMVGSLTLGKEKYTAVEADIIELKAAADALQEQFLCLIDKDAAVFEPLSRAYGMPKKTEAEQAEKTRVMEACLKECCEVPLEIMQASCRAIDLHQDFAQKGSTIAISDVGCGVVCCKAALQAASLNVFINTKWMTDRDYAAKANKQAKAMLVEYEQKADRIFAEVAARFE